MQWKRAARLQGSFGQCPRPAFLTAWAQMPGLPALPASCCLGLTRKEYCRNFQLHIHEGKAAGGSQPQHRQAGGFWAIILAPAGATAAGRQGRAGELASCC